MAAGPQRIGTGVTFSSKRAPRADVDPNPIFIRDENVYTSAGVTAGMDLALALVEEDFGFASGSCKSRATPLPRALFLRRHKAWTIANSAPRCLCN